ncbi:MAG: FAD-binding protein [Betaproteobacteria bacterium]|nr:FAD-binding protein [Betaproteobacteria bacterium]
MIKVWDSIIVGGGPAGLSAALILGRCRRSVLLIDALSQRNRFAARMHGFLTRDGISPQEFLEIARSQLRPYSTIHSIDDEVVDVLFAGNLFQARLRGDQQVCAHCILLATGVIDHLPDIEGIQPLYGHSVHHCPYCDGWEWRDKRIGAFGSGDEKGGGLALMLKQWSADVQLFSNGPAGLSPAMQARMTKQNISIREGKILRLEGEGRWLKRLVHNDGTSVPCDALFFNTAQHQCSQLASRLGCRMTARGGVDTGEHDVKTEIPGLFVAGDATRDVQLVAVAAAEGAKAAFAINRVLLDRDGLL